MLFFKFCFVYFLLFTRALFNWRVQGPCIPLSFLERPRIMFLFFFSSEVFKLFSRWNPYFRTVLHFLLILFVIMGLFFAPAHGRPANLSDHVMTSQNYIEVEHVRTWLLSSSLAKFQQFWSECFFSSFVLFTSYCLLGPCSMNAFRVLVFHWFFLEGRE